MYMMYMYGVYCVATVTTGFKFSSSKFNIVYTLYMTAIHLLMFICNNYPFSLWLSGNKLLTSRCISVHIHLLVMVYTYIHTGIRCNSV